MRSSRANAVGSKTRRDVGVGLCGQGAVSGGSPAPGQQVVHPCVRRLGDTGEDIRDPGTDGRGFSLSLTPTWGATGGDAANLWWLRDPRELTPGEAEERNQNGLESHARTTWNLSGLPSGTPDHRQGDVRNSPNAPDVEIVHVQRQPCPISSENGTLFDVACRQARTIPQSQPDTFRHCAELAGQKRRPRIKGKFPNRQTIKEDLDFGRGPLVFVQPRRHFSDVDCGHRSMRQCSSNHGRTRLLLHHGEDCRGI